LANFKQNQSIQKSNESQMGAGTTSSEMKIHHNYDTSANKVQGGSRTNKQHTAQTYDAKM
jgi:hypothetical protein